MPPILDVATLAVELARNRGNVMAAAAKFGVTRSSVQALVAKTPSLQTVLADAREGMKDHAETALHRAIDTGEAWAVCFFLKTQAKDRGYVERQEVEATAKTRIVIEEQTVDDGHPDGTASLPAAPGAG